MPARPGPSRWATSQGRGDAGYPDVFRRRRPRGWSRPGSACPCSGSRSLNRLARAARGDLAGDRRSRDRITQASPPRERDSAQSRRRLFATCNQGIGFSSPGDPIESAAEFLVADQSTCRRKQTEVRLVIVRWRQDQENGVDLVAIGHVADSGAGDAECDVRCGQPFDARMREGDTTGQEGRALLLTMLESLQCVIPRTSGACAAIASTRARITTARVTGAFQTTTSEGASRPVIIGPAGASTAAALAVIGAGRRTLSAQHIDHDDGQIAVGIEQCSATDSLPSTRRHPGTACGLPMTIWPTRYSLATRSMVWAMSSPLKVNTVAPS